ncbi:MAG: hypothetical protein J2P37_07190 [Ktedonobacteraceae bacterium]|nr:hypothetical protein [Ktedonobacteraceae bacterium]MBO0791862.1 hypothetical protein [Ktedonobacteraceae bacterium]
MSHQYKPFHHTQHLPHHDYRQPGMYFITLCTLHRQPMFGRIADGNMHLNQVGTLAQAIWTSLPQRFTGVTLDTFIFMPNHMHGIIVITKPPVRIIQPPNLANIPDRLVPFVQSQLAEKQHRQEPVTLNEIIRTFKATATRQIRITIESRFAWQQHPYKRIIQNEQRLKLMRHYIQTNPLHWPKDKFYL